MKELETGKQIKDWVFGYEEEEEDIDELEELEAEINSQEKVVEATTQSRVFDINSLSDKAPGEKYTRVDLDGQIVKVLNAEIPIPGPEVPAKNTMTGGFKTKSTRLTIYYDTPNKDRESFSGVTCFLEKDGSIGQPSIWAAGKNQAATLLQLFAKKKGVEAKEVSIKQFLSYLNSGIKVKIVGTEIPSFPDITKTIKKNMIGEFID